MPVPKKLLNLLNENNVKHEILTHKTTYTAYDEAMTLGIKPQEVAKVLVVKADKDYILTAIPASKNLDLKKLKKMVEAKKLDFIKESQIKKLLGKKTGIFSAFGSLYKLPVYLDRSLTKLKFLITNAGDFIASVKIKPKDFIKLEEPVIGSFSEAKPKKKKTKKKPVKKKTTPRKKKKIVKRKTAKNKTARKNKK